MVKICSQCKKEGDFVQSQFVRTNGKCKICQKENRQNNKEQTSNYNKRYYQDNKEQLDIQHKEYYQENKDHLIECQKNYLQENEEAKKTKKDYNKEYNKLYSNEYRKNRAKNDPAFRLRNIISRSIRAAMSRTNSQKRGSCLQQLVYTVEELKSHIEKQFEPWMTWDNQGKYNPETWKDDDQSTWTWQLDHIIPQTSLPYTSMEDENFQKCWALSNLRPLSAKQNIIDGVLRVRH